MTQKANWFSRFFLGKKLTIKPPESRSDAKSATATEENVTTVPPQKAQNELPPELAKAAIENKDRKVRPAALASVTDQALLAQVAIQDINQKVRVTAVPKVAPDTAAKIEDSEAQKDAATNPKAITKYDTSSPHFGAGMRLQYQGRFIEAKAAFEAWLAKEPKNTVAWNCKGIALHGLTKYDEAIQCFEEAIKILPDDPPTTGNMGRTFHAKGDYQRAADWLEKSLAVLPAAEYWSLKGDCLLRLGRPEAALRCFRSACDLDPTKAEYWSNEGATHAQLGSLSDALQCYQKAIDAEANCAAAWFNKADVEEKLGRIEAAKGSLETFIRLRPAGMQRQVESAYKRIQEFAKILDEQDALPMNSGTDANVPQNETETERVLALAAHSGHTQSQALLGSMLRQRGNIKEAIPWLRKAADAGDHDAQLDLGMLYVLSSAPYQNYIEAQKYLQKVARSGNREAKGAALATLSILYADGLGVHDSITKAALLATTAAYSGNKDAVELINNFGPALRQAPPNTILLMQQSIKKLQDRAATDDLNSICSWVVDNLDDLA